MERSPLERIRNQTALIGIGAAKAGTNWLAEYLIAHEQVCFSPIKELHFFDVLHGPKECKSFQLSFVRLLKNVQRHLLDGTANPRVRELAALLPKRLEMAFRPRAYLEYFDELISNEPVFGEITPAYAMLDKHGFKAIKKMLPHSKILFILRNPADRVWSHLRFTMRENAKFDPVRGVEAALAKPSIIMRTDYQRTLEQLRKIYRPSDIQILFYENLFFGECRESELKRLTDFLGIDYVPADFDQRVARSASVELGARQRDKIVKRFREVYRFVGEQFPDRIPESWLRDVEG